MSIEINKSYFNDEVKSKFINNFIKNKLIISDDYVNEFELDKEDYELENLEKELIIKTKSNSISYPKNYGNIWTDKERKIILNFLKKESITYDSPLFNDLIIIDIAKKLKRTEYGVKEEIKKMIFMEFMNGNDYKKISIKFNIPESNIKLILKLYIEKNSKKIINNMELENYLLKLQIENIKLKKELQEINYEIKDY